MTWSSLASIINLGGRLGVQIAIARLLGPEGFGSVAYIIFLVEIINAVTNLGLDKSMTRYLADLTGRDKPEQVHFLARWIYQRMLLLTVAGVLFGTLIFSLSSQYNHHPGHLLLFALLLAVRNMQNANQAYLTGRQRYGALVKINTLNTLTLLAGIIIGSRYYGLNGALVGYLLAAAIPAAYSLKIFRHMPRREGIPGELLGRLRRYAFHTWLAMAVSMVVETRMEIIFIEWFWNEHEVGMFTIGLTLTMLVRQTAVMFGNSFTPHFAQLYGSRENQRIGDTYYLATRLFALVLFPMAFGIAGLMPVLLPVIFGSDFAPAVPNAMVLAAGGALSFSMIGSSLVYGMERSRFIAVFGSLTAVISVILSLLVIPAWGAWGAVWTRTGVQTGMVVIGLIYIARRLHYPIPVSELARTLLAAVICGATAWTVIHIRPEPWAILPAIPAAVLVYIAALKHLKCLSPRDNEHFEKIITKLIPPARKPARALVHWLSLT